MQIITYNEILTKFCDDFDDLISPRAITRSNTNIIYLILKAVAKGYEIINNACVTLSNKFNPVGCSVEDLDSVAKIAGTERLKGSASGLHIIVTNNSEFPVMFYTGSYTYQLDDNTSFTFVVLEDVEIESGNFVTYIAMSEEVGVYPVTAQSDIKVTSETTIDKDISFSCNDNYYLLGKEAESDLDFRKRIINGTTNQDFIVELENILKNEPYLFDCAIKFNNTRNAVEYDGITIPPFHALINASGSIRDTIADRIAEKMIFPTVQTEDSIAVRFKNTVFVNDEQVYYITPFKKYPFDIEVKCKIDNAFISSYDAKEKMRTALQQAYVAEVHKDFITEDDVYNILQNLNITGVIILSVNLKVDEEAVDYVEIPTSRIPEVNGVSFIEV